ncbi:MAG: hypothetical protein ACRD68_16315 [Pyrinomonadaceae bacterium]
MLYIRNRQTFLSWSLLVSFVAVLAWVVPDVSAQNSGGGQNRTQVSRAAAEKGAGQARAGDEPPYHEYKGVRIGMTADEARKKLGRAQEESDQQDFYSFSEKETAQIYYDSAKKVSAVVVFYVGEASGAPACKAVLGSDVAAETDGRVYKLERYPKAGYWVSYNRMGGDSPLVTVTMKKLQ